MREKRKKRKGRFRLPYMRLRYQMLLYCFAAAAGGAAMVCSQRAEISMAFKIAVYSIAFLSLTLAVLYLIQYFFKDVNHLADGVKKKHPVLEYLSGNYRERTFLFTVPGLILNGLFALFNGYIGVQKLSAWYISLAVYYGLLCTMRFRFLSFAYFNRKKAYDKSRERRIFSQCGVILIIMSIALCGMVILIVQKGNGKSYPEYLTYAIAMYTFIKMGTATANMIKARRFHSLQVIGIRNIGYADALVSVLSLQTAMFSAFDEKSRPFHTTMNEITGAVVCAVVVTLGITMVRGNRK